ncbi:hypothetical protein KJ359_008881 [Pestalotiopsis sp. 9143b]|nr:hypothetical protein KJ359_008881 [Pestalotiopsis sp. 9143b]
MDETRRRVFHTLRQMDIYLSTTLGLPLPLQDKDIDQAWPTEVDDEYITERAIHKPSHDRASFLEAFNAHARLMQILAKVVDHLYPPTMADRESTDMTYMISVAKIREMEEDLHSWHESLSSVWRPGPEEDLEIARYDIHSFTAPIRIDGTKDHDGEYTRRCKTYANICAHYRIKVLLRFAYAHVQMMLYRPFLQYYSQQTSTVKTVDDRYFALATAGINSLFNHLPDRFKSKDQGTVPASASTSTQPHLKTNASNQFLQAVLSSTSPQQPWSPGARSNQGEAQPGADISLARDSVVTGSHAYVSGPSQYEVPSSLMDFPIEDPFAYPLLPGVSLADDTFAMLPEDSLHLPIFDANMNIEGQLLHLNNIQLQSHFPSHSTGQVGYQPY